MGFQLIAISGPARGVSWDVAETPLVLGRDPSCHVTLSDPAVSRRHCEIVQNGDRVTFRDLGSRNPALVNGRPCDEVHLKPGDEVALGQSRFLLVCNSADDRMVSVPDAEGDTWSWEKSGKVSLALGTAGPALHGGPRTIQDLAMLYEVTRELSACTTTDELMAGTRRRLFEHFNPLRLWLALVHDDRVPVFIGQGLDGEEPVAGEAPVEAVRQALDGNRGFLVPGSGRNRGSRALTFTLVSPVSLGDVPLAAIALQTEVPAGAYDEDDLRFLVLFAQSLAPILCAVRNLERLRRDKELLEARVGEKLELLGKSRGICRVRAQIEKAARSELNVLITGETGTGKELAARLLHSRSTRWDRPLVVVNCAAIPRDLFESQLFGYEKGAFTGAEEPHAGLMAEADGGTLFLDEVGDLSLDNQARILRAIELGTFRRIGATQDTRVDLRVIAATNKDVPAAIKSGAFREDLYHRLNGFEIDIPPLRKRPSDIPPLARHFFELHRHRAKRPLSGISPDALAHLQSRRWPGNVRELVSCVQRAIAVARGECIEVSDLLDRHDVDRPEEGSLSLAEVEKGHIERVLGQCHGNVPKAAEILQIGRSTLYKKIRRYGL